MTIRAVTHKAITVCGNLKQAEKLVHKAIKDGYKNSKIFISKGEA